MAGSSSDTTTSSNSSTETDEFEGIQSQGASIPAGKTFAYVMRAARPAAHDIVRLMGIDSVKLPLLSKSLRDTTKRPEIAPLILRNKIFEMVQRRAESPWRFNAGPGLMALLAFGEKTKDHWKRLSDTDLKTLLLAKHGVLPETFSFAIHPSRRAEYAKMPSFHPYDESNTALYKCRFQIGLITDLIDYDEWRDFACYLRRGWNIYGFWETFFKDLPNDLQTTWDDLHFLMGSDSDADSKTRGLDIPDRWELHRTTCGAYCSVDHYLLACIVRARARRDPEVLHCMEACPPLPPRFPLGSEKNDQKKENSGCLSTFMHMCRIA